MFACGSKRQIIILHVHMTFSGPYPEVFRRHRYLKELLTFFLQPPWLPARKEFKASLQNLISYKNEFWGVKHLTVLPLLHSIRTFGWVKMGRGGGKFTISKSHMNATEIKLSIKIFCQRQRPRNTQYYALRK